MSGRVAVCTKDAYVSTSPLSQAIRSDTLLYCSGQVPVSPVTGGVPDGIEAQTSQVMENLKAVLEAAGSSMADVIKTTVFLVDARDLPGMNKAYACHFDPPLPARTAVIVAGLAKPEWRVEIEMVAASRGGRAA